MCKLGALLDPLFCANGIQLNQGRGYECSGGLQATGHASSHLMMLNEVGSIWSERHMCERCCRQRSRHYYPAWAWVLPATLLRIPISLVMAILCTAILYWVMGFDTNAGRCDYACICTASPESLL